jgi:hypothetical protein
MQQRNGNTLTKKVNDMANNIMGLNMLSEPYTLGHTAIIGFCIDHTPFKDEKKKIELPRELKRFENLLIIVNNDDHDDLVVKMTIADYLPEPGGRHIVKFILIATESKNLPIIWDVIKPVEKPVISPYSFC